MTAKKTTSPGKGSKWNYLAGLDLEIMTNPPLHVTPHQQGITAVSVSQAEHMAASPDFEPAKAGE